MATVEEVARSVLAAYRSSASIITAGQWVTDRFRQAASRSRLRAFRQLGQISLPAPLSTGTVTTTTGSTLVTGNAAAYATWSQALVGRHFRTDQTWYEIESVTTTTLTLTSAVTDDGDSGLGYEIVQRYTDMPADLAYLGSVVHAPTRREVQRRSLLELDMMFPSRGPSNSAPCYYAEVSRSIYDRRRMEFFPYSNEAITLHLAYWSTPPKLGLHDEIPQGLDPWVLREGAMIDLYRYEMSMMINSGKVQEAEILRNEMRTQKTQWDTREINELVRSDSASDDIMFIASNIGLNPGDITTAEQHVWANG